MINWLFFYKNKAFYDVTVQKCARGATKIYFVTSNFFIGELVFTKTYNRLGGERVGDIILLHKSMKHKVWQNAILPYVGILHRVSCNYCLQCG